MSQRSDGLGRSPFGRFHRLLTVAVTMTARREQSLAMELSRFKPFPNGAVKPEPCPDRNRSRRRSSRFRRLLTAPAPCIDCRQKAAIDLSPIGPFHNGAPTTSAL